MTTLEEIIDTELRTTKSMRTAYSTCRPRHAYNFCSMYLNLLNHLEIKSYF